MVLVSAASIQNRTPYLRSSVADLFRKLENIKGFRGP